MKLHNHSTVIFRQLLVTFFCVIFVVFGSKETAGQDDMKVVSRLDNSRRLAFCDSALKVNYNFELAGVYLEKLYEFDSIELANKHYRWVLSRETTVSNRKYFYALLKAIELKYDTSLLILDTLIKAYPKHELALVLKANLLQITNRHSDLKTHVSDALMHYPKNRNLLYFDVYCYYQENKLQFARFKVEKALAIVPDEFRLLQIASLVYVAVEDFPKAHKVLSDLLSIWPDSHFGNSTMGGVLQTMDSSIQALPYRLLAFSSNHATVYDAVTLIDLVYDMEEMDSVCSYIEKTEKKLDRSADTTDEYKSYWDYLDRTKQSVCVSGTSRYFFQRGIAAFNTGKYQQADSFYQLANSIKLSRCLMPYFFGNSALAQGNLEAAYAYYKEAFGFIDEYETETLELYRVSNDPDAKKYFYAEMFSRRAEWFVHTKQTDSALLYAQLASKWAKGLSVEFADALKITEVWAFIASGNFAQAKLKLTEINTPFCQIEKQWCLQVCRYYECSKSKNTSLRKTGMSFYQFVPVEFLEKKESTCLSTVAKISEEIKDNWKLMPHVASEYYLILGILNKSQGLDPCEYLTHTGADNNAEVLKLRDSYQCK